MEEFSAKVIKVIDGDTLVVVDEKGVKKRVRIFGIDSPELDQPYGVEAKEELVCFLEMFDNCVRVEPFEVDRYGRAVSTVYAGAENVAVYLLRAGAAWLYTVYARFNSEYAEYKRNIDAAKAERCGLWVETEPIPPWRWRYNKKHALGSC